MYDILNQYSNSFHSDFWAMIDANGDELRTKQYRSKVTENFKNDLKIHQSEMIKCKKKTYILLYLRKRCNSLQTRNIGGQ